MENNKVGIKVFGHDGYFSLQNIVLTANTHGGIDFQNIKPDSSLVTYFYITNSITQNHSSQSAMHFDGNHVLDIENGEFNENIQDIWSDATKRNFLFPSISIFNSTFRNAIYSNNYRIFISQTKNLTIKYCNIIDINSSFLFTKAIYDSVILTNNLFENWTSDFPFISINEMDKKTPKIIKILSNTFRGGFSNIKVYKPNFYPKFIPSTLSIHSVGKVIISRNIFDNPQLEYELGVSSSSPYLTSQIDGRENFWGTDEISNRILSDNSAFRYRAVNIFPYFVNREMTTKKDNFSISTESLNRNSTFRRGNHRVKGILKVTESSIFTIEDGAELEFYPDSGIFVDGKMDILGIGSDSIKFRSLPRKDDGLFYSDNNNILYFQLSPNISFPVSSYTSPMAASAICLSQGYAPFEYESFKNIKSSPGMTVQFECYNPSIANCKRKFVFNQNSLYLKCKRSGWSGIHFLLNSKPSFLRGFTLSDVRDGPSLFFQVLQHRLENVTLNILEMIGMGIGITYPSSISTIHNTNILCKIPCNNIIHGRDSLHITNSTFQNASVQIESRKIFWRPENYPTTITEISNENCEQVIFLGDEKQNYIFLIELRRHDDLCFIKFENNEQFLLKIQIVSQQKYIINQYPIFKNGKNENNIEEDFYETSLDDREFRFISTSRNIFQRVYFTRYYIIFIEKVKSNTLEIQQQKIFSISNCIFENSHRISLDLQKNFKNGTIVLTRNIFKTIFYVRITSRLEKSIILIDECNFKRFKADLTNGKLLKITKSKFNEHLSITLNADVDINTLPIFKVWLENSTLLSVSIDDVTSIYNKQNKEILMKYNTIENISCKESEVIKLAIKNLGRTIFSNNFFNNIEGCKRIIMITNRKRELVYTRNTFENIAVSFLSDDLASSHSDFSENLYKNVSSFGTGIKIFSEGKMTFSNNTFSYYSAKLNVINLFLIGKNNRSKILKFNRFKNNKSPESLLELNGDSHPLIQKNLFSNPQCKYDIRTNIHCFRENLTYNCTCNAKYNYFNNQDPTTRIFSSKQNGLLSKIDISPISLSADYENFKVLGEKKANYLSLQGLIEEEIEIKTNTTITNNVIFTKKIKIREGIEINFKNCFNSIIFRQKFEIVGGKDMPVIFKQNVKPFFLSIKDGKRLKIFYKQKWRFVLFEKKSNFIEDNERICELMCLKSKKIDKLTSMIVENNLDPNNVFPSNCLFEKENVNECVENTDRKNFNYSPLFECSEARDYGWNHLILYNPIEESSLKNIQLEKVSLSIMSGPVHILGNISCINDFSSSPPEVHSFQVDFKNEYRNGFILLNTKHAFRYKANWKRSIRNDVIHNKYTKENILNSNIELFMRGLPNSFCSADKILELKEHDFGYLFDLSSFHSSSIFSKDSSCSTIFRASDGNILIMKAKCQHNFMCGKMNIYDAKAKNFINSFEIFPVR